MMDNCVEEIWTPVNIPGYSSSYWVSSKGNVYSNYTKKVLKPKRSPAGYLRVGLCNGVGPPKQTTIHRIVALSFLNNPNNKPTVNHKNEIKTDNRAENLEWATTLEQNTHGTRIAREVAHTDFKERSKKMNYADIASKHDYKGQQMCGRKKTVVLKDGIVVGVFDSAKEAARAVGVNYLKATECANGKIKQVMGYEFRYYRR